MMVYLDGAFIPEQLAYIGCSDRGFLFGDGVYVTVRVRDGWPLFLEDHLKRLYNSLQAFQIELAPLDPKLIFELIERNKAYKDDYKLQIIVTGGKGAERNLKKRIAGHLLMMLKKAPPVPSQPLRCVRYPDSIMIPHGGYKTLAHLSRYCVLDYATNKGADDAVTFWEDYLCETAFGNLFWIEGNCLYTPSKGLPLHYGQTISKIAELADEWGYQMHQVKMRLQEIVPEAHLYRCSSLAGIVPVESIESHLFAKDKTLDEKLNQRLYEAAMVRG